MTATDAITLRGMRFHARVGILPHELTTAQPIEVDLTVHVRPGDEQASVVDYRALYAIAASVVNAGHIDFLEQIAASIADGALAHSPRVISARVAVRKPHVALGGPLDYAEVVVERAAHA